MAVVETVGFKHGSFVTKNMTVVVVAKYRCYSMPRIKELPRKMLKTTVKVTFNTEDRTVESMQRLSQVNSLDVILVIYCAFYMFDIKCCNLKVF